MIDDPVAAILTNDWHLWPKPPLYRTVEPDWLQTMAGYLEQVTNLFSSSITDVPIVFAGDMFDKPDPPASFISWCLDHVPECFVVAGQHDLTNHRLQDIDKTGLGVMIKTGRCRLLYSNSPIPVYRNNLVLHGYSWEQTVTPLRKQKEDKALHLAVIHAYIWTKNTCYPGAPDESRLGAWQEKLKGFDAAVFGDNHKAFINTKGECSVLNNGTFMIRKSDEKTHKPTVGLLHESGRITRHYLDTSKDKYLDLGEIATELAEHSDLDVKELMDELEKLGDQGLDFVSSVKQWCDKNKVEPEIKKLLLEFLG